MGCAQTKTGKTRAARRRGEPRIAYRVDGYQPATGEGAVGTVVFDESDSRVVTPSGRTHTPIAVHQPVAVADQPSAKRSCRTQALSMTISAGSIAIRAASSIAGSESSSETTLC